MLKGLSHKHQLIILLILLVLFIISIGMVFLTFVKNQLEMESIHYQQLELLVWALVVQCLLAVVLLGIYVFKRLIKPLEALKKGVTQLGDGKIVYFPKFADETHSFIADYITKLSIKVQHLALDKATFQSESSKDPLTSLANRRVMETFLREQLGHADRYDHELHVLMIDIDKFKLLNDNYGHQVGDLCLQELARLLSYNTRRTNELAARYGGEEFILIISGMRTPEVVEWAEQIRMQVETLKVYLSKENTDYVSFTLSIGVCSLKAHQAKTIEQMIEFADKALYEAKSMGRNQIRIYCPEG